MTASAGQVPAPADGKTFYKRLLACPPAVSFSSPEGKSLFAEALQAGTMQVFFKLIEQFRTQDEPAYCGLASLAMVLNALAIDPKRAWKGPWRWFHEQMLDCCQPLSQVLQTGIVLDQAACLARCNGAKAELWRYGDFSEDSFRRTVHGVCTSDQQHLIVSYSRKEFLQTGDGHFSPVGGYHAGQDMVLILDTARFKYPPHWVPLKRLHQAMAHVDSATGQPRGYISIRANPRLESVMFTLNRPNRAWQVIKSFIDTSLPVLLQQPPLTSSQAQSAHSTEALTQTASAHITTSPVFELQNPEHIDAAMALLPVVTALPKDSILQLMAVRSGSIASCCISPEAASIFPAAGKSATKAACTSQAVTEAASITPTVAQAATEAACTPAAAAEAATEAASITTAAAESTTEPACTSPAAVEAACISPAATSLFLSELHSTDLYQIVRRCLDQAQEQSAAAQLLPCSPAHHPSMHKTPTAGHALHHGQAEGAKLLPCGASFESIPSSIDKAAPSATAATCDRATTLAMAPVNAQMSSHVGHDSNVNESIRQTMAETAASNHQSLGRSQQQMGVADTEACQLPGTAVQASCRTQVDASVPGSTMGHTLDCRATCLAATPAEQAAAETHAASAGDASPPLAEMICMLLLLVPRSAWQYACDEVQMTVLPILDMSLHSIVASEADYLAAQWAELPQLQSLERATSCA